MRSRADAPNSGAPLNAGVMGQMSDAISEERVPSMVSEGVKIRAQIDTESVRNVMLVNGGGSVALLALLPAILGTPLVFALFLTLAVWLVGLTLAVTHSVLRRKCSLVYEQHGMNTPHGTPRLGIKPKQPWVCWWSWQCLYASIVAFLIGGALMVSFGFANLDTLSAARKPTFDQASEVHIPHNKSLQPTQKPRG